jgi:hypothetical protein
VDRRLEILRRDLRSILPALAAAFVVAACSHEPGPAAGGASAEIRALGWLADDADKVAFLTTKPPACERPSGNEAEAAQRELGRIAFESPALLGGAAARAGLSCASCHVNGRGNPAFFIRAVSDKPGMADVTSSIFSKVRGDGDFNPVPIPDLAARDGKQIKDRRSAEFRAKVHGLVVEEFDGQEPPPEVFEALLIYLDGLDLAACASAVETRGYREDFEAAMRAATLAQAFPAEPEAALFYLRASRERLERLNERYAGRDLSNARGRLIAMSRRLAEASDLIREGKRPPLADADEWALLGLALQQGDEKSLYDRDVLRAALAD